MDDIRQVFLDRLTQRERNGSGRRIIIVGNFQTVT